MHYKAYAVKCIVKTPVQRGRLPEHRLRNLRISSSEWVGHVSNSEEGISSKVAPLKVTNTVMCNV
jgi:hypothetical protein